MVKSSNLGSSHSRKKINYKPNGFLAKHPYLRNRMIQPEVARSYIAESSRAPLTTQQGRAIAGTPAQYLLQSFYIVEETTNIELESQSFEEVLNEAEDGEIFAIECVTNSPAITVEVVTYGLGNTASVINDYSMIEMIRRGRGMTPGEVEILPSGRSKDPSGTPRRYYPYVARYKDDNLIDHIEDERRYFVFVYEPATPMPYSSIIVNLKNTSTEGRLIVDSINIHRRVYGSPVTNEIVNATEFDSAQLYVKEKVEVPETVPVAPNQSPFAMNYVKKAQQEQELANMPEIIESDDLE